MAEPTEADLIEYPLLKYMQKHGVLITRENYIRYNWTPDIIPDPWTVSDEADLPEGLQDHERFPQLKD